MRKPITPNTIKRLFALSGNQCAFEPCSQKLTDEHGNLFAEVCHIEAAELGGERYNPSQTDEERRVFENLLLLCANHHIETDNEEIWTVEKLQKLKEEHENEFLNQQFEISDETAQKASLLDYLESVAVDLDRACTTLASTSLERIKGTVESFNDEKISLEFGLLEAKALKASEKPVEAKAKYESLTGAYQNDPRPILYLAEQELDVENLEKNLALIQQAEELDPNHWLLALEKLVRDIRQGNKVDTTIVDEDSFPVGNRERSAFYRLYAICYERNKEHDKANQFIEKAIRINPDRLSNYQIKLALINGRFSGKNVYEVTEKQKLEVLDAVNDVINKYEEWGADGPIEKISLLVIKIDPLAALGRFVELEQILKELFEACLQCNFGPVVEEALLKLLSGQFPDNDLERLLDYLGKDNVQIGEYLSKVLVYQFLMKNGLLDKGKDFFTKKTVEKALAFIKSIEENNVQGVLEFTEGDLVYTQGLIAALGGFPNLRLELLKEIEKADIPNKEMVWIPYYYENEDYQKAYEMLLSVNIDHLIAPQCRMYADIAKKADNWKKELEILDKWLQLEENDTTKLNIKLAKFTANASLGKFTDVIAIGEELLSDELMAQSMDKENREILLGHTVIAHVNRGQYEEGLKLIEKYPNIPYTFNFKCHVQARLYFDCGDIKNGIKSVVEGLKQLDNPSDEQYGSLFGHLIQIPAKDGFTLDEPDEVVADGSFVKLKNEDKWYYLGEEKPLDAFDLTKTDERYGVLIGNKCGDIIQFPRDKYTETKERIIEHILPVERYVFWRARECFTKLAQTGHAMGTLIHVPEKDGEVDLSKMIEFMADLHEPDKEPYELFCSQAYPVALLAFQQGGLTNAIGKIGQERRGFIRLSDGTSQENDKQIQVANKILTGSEVYLDATSALFLAETGLLEKIKPHIPNLKVPQSVINFLFDTVEKFRIAPGNVGRMGYTEGKLTYNKISLDLSESIRDKMKKTIALLESDTEAIETVAKASKAEVWTESKMPGELSDACILAQEKEAVVFTDDYLYLHANALQTKKAIPEYCSTFILMKVLLDKGLVSFEDYTNYFSYLASYRCRFLGLSVDDLMKAIFGEGDLIVLQPENLRKFHLYLTLSEEYGIPLKIALAVIYQFLSKIIADDSIPVETANKIFVEVVPSFLEGRVSDKGNASILIAGLCKKQIGFWRTEAKIAIPMVLADEKLANLESQIDLLSSGSLSL